MDNEEYKNYKLRAQFFNATKRTHNGIAGLLNRKLPLVTIPDNLKQYLSNVDGKGHTFNQFVNLSGSDSLITNWGGYLVDMPDNGDTENISQLEYEQRQLSAYITYYKAEDITNWHWKNKGRKTYLELVIFKEKSDELDNYYSLTQKYNYRVCEIDSEGNYKQSIYNDEGELLSVIYPKDSKGKVLKFIPFWFIGDEEPEESMYLDLVNVNLSHYRKSADLENGAHWTGVPTAYVTGAEPETKPLLDEDGNVIGEEAVPLRLGGTTVHYFPNPSSRMAYLEFSGQGCSLLQSMMISDEERMAILGARIISNEKKGVESAETTRIHNAAENSVLADCANYLSDTLTKVLKFYLEWSSGELLNEEDVRVQLNTDYDISNMSASELTALISAWQSGGISKKVLFKNLKEGELIDNQTSFEDMEEDIAEEKNTMLQQNIMQQQTIMQSGFADNEQE